MNGQPRWWQTLLAFVVVVAVAGVGLFVVLRPGTPAAAPLPHPPSGSSPAPAPSVSTSGSSSPSPSEGGGQRGGSRKERDRAQHAADARHRRERTTRFVVSTFNVLGFVHTTPQGNKHRFGWAGGHRRMRWAVSLLEGHHVSVAGLQEFETPQYRTFRALVGSRYGVYPGDSQGGGPVQNSIVWRQRDWSLVRHGTIPVRYFYGHVIPMPYVLLRNRHTGREVWFANYHNPANVRGPAQRFREYDTRLEARLFQRLLRSHPLIVTGDMNEGRGYFCRLSAAIPSLHAANGAHRSGAACHTPAGTRIDWIIGSRKVGFSRYTVTRRGVERHTSDHPLVLAVASIPG